MSFSFNRGYGRRAIVCGAIAAFAMPVALVGTSAEARIKCVNGNQIVSGSPIATPYCQDELVAKVAREYGVKVSADAVRNNPNLKRNVCAHVGRDIRIYQACIDTNSTGRRGF
ncbi:hypothetical protein [uncultured Hyphomicrobium sp.]|uniref:hypothetical protein n=1 Tax=uncultured Hyphomicrobium sp. TaxID=194373 RepID=UPI0025D88995|nr:hypothetical protein [uncultured Hyphomicrobium sp.]